MDYQLKVIINGVEILEASEETLVDGVVNTSPSITNVKLYNNACSGTMTIGATAQDSLVFEMLNPYKLSFDGNKVEFFVCPPTDTENTTAETIAETVGESQTTEVIDVATLSNNITEDVETGEEPTAEDLVDIATTTEELTENQYAQFEGEASTETSLATVTASTWEKIGVYYVNEQKTSDDMSKVTLTCYDGFCKMSDKFTPTNTTATIQAMYDDLKSQVLANCGVTIAAFEYPTTISSKEITWTYLCSYREAFGYLCGLVGGYATFTADGTGDISWYSYTGEVLIKDDLTSYQTTSAGEMIVEGIRCNKSTNTFREDYVTVGDGLSISFVNPFIDEDELGEIYDEYRDIRFTGATVSCNYTSSLQAGEFARVFTSAEYENYLKLGNAYKNDDTLSDSDRKQLESDMNSLGDVILISSQVVDFYGDASTVITSYCQSEAAKANVPMSPSDAKFANLYAETITTRDLVADKADINMLNVTNANVQELVAGSINGSIIRDGTIIAAALSNEAVQTLGGSKVWYQAEEPTDGVKEGDSWYKTVVPTGYDGNILFVYTDGEWVGTDLDAKLIRANTITSQEIATNTIEASNIRGGSLDIGCMDDTVASATSQSRLGRMQWNNDTLKISSKSEDGTSEYATEISGDGIAFKYNGDTTASIDQDKLVIGKTVVLTDMVIGNWAWTINPLSGHLQVKWQGGN